MNPFGYDYPPGAEHDPRAPWNQPCECEACDGEGKVIESDVMEECPECHGTGREKTRAELRDEWEEHKADIGRDDE